MHKSAAAALKPSSILPRPLQLQRSCGCGGSCGGCRKERTLQATAPPLAHEVLREPGQPLDGATRSFMEPRFAHDFSQVRVHTGPKAAASARALSAAAYTVGSDVVFGSGGYRPGSAAGNKLLAHELSHVVQQAGGTGTVQRQALGGTIPVGAADDASEKEADSVAESVMSGAAPRIETHPSSVLRRRLVVDPNGTVPLPAGAAGPATPLTIAVQGLINETCPSGNFEVNVATGNVTARDNAFFCQWHPPLLPDTTMAGQSPTPTGCRCLCDVVNHAQTTTIARGGHAPGTTPVGPTGTGPGSPTVNADPTFQGQYLINGTWVDVPFHLIFSHELCGHALPLMQGTQVARGRGPVGGTPPHEVHSVDVERRIAAEHNPPLPRRPEDYGGAARERP